MVPEKSELLLIRKLLKQSICDVMQEDFFPDGLSGFAAAALEHFFKLQYVSGFYQDRRNEKHAHAWNYDAEGELYVDITLDQFRGITEPVVVLPRDTLLLVPEHFEPCTLWSNRLCSNGQTTFAHFLRLYNHAKESSRITRSATLQ